jgi:gamma-glutamyltranspeptidase
VVVPGLPDSPVMQAGVFGSRWAIASPHLLATEAGAAAFEQGGNAIDAAVAAAVTLAVVYPHMCGVGGDLIALVQQPTGEAMAVNASGRAPSGADQEAARTAGGGRMPERGPHTVTVPGAVSGWEAVHRLGGVLPWRDLFTRAVALAHGGVAVSRSLASVLEGSDAPRAGSGDPLGEIFAPDGMTLRTGSLFRQPALGTTLQRVATEGSSVLYGGEIGDRYAAGLRDAGVPITPEDLASHRADLVSPLATRYRDADVLVHPPNSQGFVLLEILAAIERLGIDPDPMGPDAGAMALVFRAAARDRDLHLADPDTMRVHPSTLLDDGHLAVLTDEVRAGLLQGSDDTTPRPSGDTIALVTADADGRAVSLIQSLFYGFGSGILEPATGIVAQNRGGCFTLEPDHANVLGPGKRPAHTLMPVLARRRNALAAVTGTMGGYAQPQINAMNLLRTLDLRQPPHEAIAAPRWLLGGMDPMGDAEPLVLAEADVPAVAIDSLQRIGFRVDMVAKEDEATGHAHLIRAGSAGFEVAGDPRSDGGAIAG